MSATKHPTAANPPAENACMCNVIRLPAPECREIVRRNPWREVRDLRARCWVEVPEIELSCGAHWIPGLRAEVPERTPSLIGGRSTVVCGASPDAGREQTDSEGCADQRDLGSLDCLEMIRHRCLLVLRATGGNQ